LPLPATLIRFLPLRNTTPKLGRAANSHSTAATRVKSRRSTLRSQDIASVTTSAGVRWLLATTERIVRRSTSISYVFVESICLPRAPSGTVRIAGRSSSRVAVPMGMPMSPTTAPLPSTPTPTTLLPPTLRTPAPAATLMPPLPPIPPTQPSTPRRTDPPLARPSRRLRLQLPQVEATAPLPPTISSNFPISTTQSTLLPLVQLLPPTLSVSARRLTSRGRL
jgi:hypothetical protein